MNKNQSKAVLPPLPPQKPKPARAKPRQNQQGDAHEAEGRHDTQLVSALSRGLSLLDCFTRNDISLGNAELAARSGLNTSTVSRLTYTLAVHHYLGFDARTREYRLGPRAVRLGAIASAANCVRTLALPHMRSFATGSQFNVGLGMRDGQHMVYTDTCEGDALVALRLFPGSRIPMLTSAMGRAYLAACPSAERDEILTSLRPRFGNDWAHVIHGVETALDEYQRLGYCSSIGDWQKDIHGIAAPIAAPSGGALYVLNLGGPAYALTEGVMRERHAPILLSIIHQMESILFPDDLFHHSSDGL